MWHQCAGRLLAVVFLRSKKDISDCSALLRLKGLFDSLCCTTVKMRRLDRRVWVWWHRRLGAAKLG